MKKWWLCTFLLVGCAAGAATQAAEQKKYSALELLELVQNDKTSTPELEQRFFDEFIRQISQNGAEDKYIQISWTGTYRKARNQFVEIIKKNSAILNKFLHIIPTLPIRTNRGLHTQRALDHFLDNLLNNQTIGEQIAQIVGQNVNTADQIILQKVFQKYPDAIANLFVTQKTTDIKKMPYATIKVIFENASDQVKLKLAVMLKTIKIKGGLFRNFVKQKAGYFALKKFPAAFAEQSKPKTQSEQHLKQFENKVKSNFSAELKKKPVRKMFKKLHKKEKAEQKKGRYTFAHAQPWKFNYLNDLFTLLWEARYEEKIEDYHFLRFTPKGQYNLKKEIKKREKALALTDGYGWRTNRARKEKDIAGRLFLNHAIFGNTGWRGECSANYWLTNCNHGNLGIDSKYIFWQLGLEKVYKKYAKQLEKLEQQHKDLSKYGNMLLISLSEDQLKKCVKAVEPCGWENQKVTIQDETGKSKTTEDIKEILDTLRNNPEKIQENTNFLQYCMMLTHDCALDPHNGPRIYSFNAPDQKKFAEYKKTRDELFAKIAEDIELLPMPPKKQKTKTFFNEKNILLGVGTLVGATIGCAHYFLRKYFPGADA